MSTITIGKNGIVYVHTNVILPRNLKDFAKEQGISMSHELRTSLEKKMKEGNARGQNATNTETPAPLSSARDEVDKL